MLTPTLHVTALLSSTFISRRFFVTASTCQPGDPPTHPPTQPFSPFRCRRRCRPTSSTPPGTLLHEALVRFAFDVMASGKEACNKQDVMGLVSLLHADVGRVKETTATLMGIMDPHNRNKISFDTFRYEGVGAAAARVTAVRTVLFSSFGGYHIHPSTIFFVVCVVSLG